MMYIVFTFSLIGCEDVHGGPVTEMVSVVMEETDDARQSVAHQESAIAREVKSGRYIIFMRRTPYHRRWSVAYAFAAFPDVVSELSDTFAAFIVYLFVSL